MRRRDKPNTMHVANTGEFAGPGNAPMQYEAPRTAPVAMPIDNQPGLSFYSGPSPVMQAEPAESYSYSGFAGPGNRSKSGGPQVYSGGGGSGGGDFLQSASSSSFEDEPPLLEELGINPQHIYQKTLAVLNPLRYFVLNPSIRPVDPSILEDSDLAGPLAFTLLLGALLLLHGKIHFGYLFGFGALGCLGMYGLMNLMSASPIALSLAISILGYCLLPMVLLTLFAVFIELRSVYGFVLTLMHIGWCTYTASLMFVRVLAMHEQRILVAYPIALLYAVFALITVF